MESINYQNFRIDAENICVDYNGKVALYDANLRLKHGQICGLVGMNGAGKTTFFNALTGFVNISNCLLYTSPSPRDGNVSRMPSSA